MFSCVDRLDERIGREEPSYIVVDGFISNEPGPYVVKIFRTKSLYSNLSGTPFPAKEVSIEDQSGNVEILSVSEPGTYTTGSSKFIGQIGNKYKLMIIDFDKNVFESDFSEIKDPGRLDSVYTEFASLSTEGLPKYGYKIFVNASVEPVSESFIRWRYSGVYQFRTFPELNTEPHPVFPGIAPDVQGEFFLCLGGFPFDPGKCECCLCWKEEFENRPTLAAASARNGKFIRIEAGFVPINDLSFNKKFRVEIKQMNLNKHAYSYFSKIEDQIQATKSLFQPPYSNPTTNLKHKNGNIRIEGIFYAAGSVSKEVYISKSDLPREVRTQIPDSLPITIPCDKAILGASNKKPPNWRD